MGSVRARMTLLYSGVFTVITVGVLVAAQRFQQSLFGDQVNNFATPGANEGPVCDEQASGQGCPPLTGVPGAASTGPSLRNERDELLQSLVNTQWIVTVIVIAVIAALALAVCWWLTGRLLRPLHRVTSTARRLSLSTLHERIALTGPQDELKDLADTFDAMLDRLEHSVASQRRFVANASHELRTPLAIQRTAIEIGLADPAPEKVARMRTELLRATERSERLIEGLLVLAKGEQELDARTPVDLAIVVEQVIGEHQPLAGHRGVTLTAASRPAVVMGDEVLLTRLVANLVHNAIKYNHPGGRVLVELSPEAGLVVSNTGAHVPPEQIDELFEPFRRLDRDRTRSADGAGLGLSIVAAIGRAHGSTIQARANPGGGLSITVAFPALTASVPRDRAHQAPAHQAPGA